MRPTIVLVEPGNVRWDTRLFAWFLRRLGFTVEIKVEP